MIMGRPSETTAFFWLLKDDRRHLTVPKSSGDDISFFHGEGVAKIARSPFLAGLLMDYFSN